ncbi:hypothetical protein OAL15_03305 [Flavobacteriales bacterium]|nr:hypothetical protein [Flavobacteriales bacterium]
MRIFTTTLLVYLLISDVQGQYKMKVSCDGENTRTHGNNYKYFTEDNIDPSIKYIVSMAVGGGWVGVIRKIIDR